jgi:nicotinamidase-related amidase
MLSAAGTPISANIGVIMQKAASLPLPAEWALLVIDMQNDFLDRGGYYARRAALEAEGGWRDLTPEEQCRRLDESAPQQGLGAHSPEVERLVANVVAAIGVARSADRPIAFVRALYDRGFDTIPPFMANDPDRRHAPCRPGSWGADLVAPIAAAKRDVEQVFDKHAYDALTAAPLRDFLEKTGTTGLVACGVETQVCVLATAQHAALIGYRSFILEDGVWSPKADTAEAALTLFRDAYGGTLTLDDLTARAI